MVKFDYYIRDNFDARHLYNDAIFLAKMSQNNGVEFIGGKADKKNYSWEEAKIKINGNTIILHLNTPHESGKRIFNGETLKIKFEGDEKTRCSAKRGLEGITGIKISEESRT